LNDRYEELELLLGWVQRLRQADAESLEMQFLNKRDQDGNTALHLAAYHNRFKAVKLLVKSLQPPGGVCQENASEESKKSVGTIVINRKYFYVL
ncbi:unnamed protein product, partial [Brassica rapa subsp. trilocularis]